MRAVLGERHRWHAVRGYLHELGGDLPAAAAAYAEAARRATNVAERDHLVRQAARARARAPVRRSAPVEPMTICGWKTSPYPSLAASRTAVLLIELVGTLNTGDAGGQLTAEPHAI